MNQEHRVLMASLLAILVLFVYAQFSPRTPGPVDQGQMIAPQAGSQERQIEARPELPVIQQEYVEEDVVTISSPSLSLEIGAETAAVRAVYLNRFDDLETGDALKFEPEHAILATILASPHSAMRLVQHGARSVSWEVDGEDGLRQELSIVLDEELPIFTVGVRSINETDVAFRGTPLQFLLTWRRGEGVVGRYNRLEAVLKTERTGAFQREYVTFGEGARKEKLVPRGTSVVAMTERHFCQVMRLEGPASATLLPSEKGVIAVSVDPALSVPANSRVDYEARVYIGPRGMSHLKEVGFEDAFKVGILAQIGMVLMVFLEGIASVTKNYGVAIILLSGGITVAFGPFTMLSVRSMKKMQLLQPKIEQVKKKYAKDPQKMNQETFALFKANKVSPLGGCLPMLFQFPVLIAFWLAISHVVELRGATFLWIQDLSLPDRLATLPMGFELNILPLVMALAMFLQTKMSGQGSAATGPAKMLSGPMMPILFGVLFYKVPACIVLYWLTNSLASLGFYRMAKT